ncbi:MAG: citrate/2-methylcitrate synthase [Acidimicrobiales bacterium]
MRCRARCTAAHRAGPLDLLDEIGTPDRIDAVVGAHLDAGERIMGFGHAVYRTEDPRSRLLRQVVRDLGGPLVDLPSPPRHASSTCSPPSTRTALQANVEWYAAVVLATVGVPRELFGLPTFATFAPSVSAHAVEQAAERHILRPSARYIGAGAPTPVLPR